mgnify:FL=1
MRRRRFGLRTALGKSLPASVSAAVPAVLPPVTASAATAAALETARAAAAAVPVLPAAAAATAPPTAAASATALAAAAARAQQPAPGPLSPWRLPSLALARDIYRADGIGAFYRGVVASAFLFSTSSAVWWGTFSLFMEALAPLTATVSWMRAAPGSLSFLSTGTALTPPLLSPRCVALLEEHPWWVQHLAAALAGVASIVLTNPVDVCRTRLMVLARRGDGLTMRVLLTRLLTEEGPRALMAGVVPRTLSYLPVSVAIMTAYQVSKVVALEVRIRRSGETERAAVAAVMPIVASALSGGKAGRDARREAAAMDEFKNSRK